MNERELRRRFPNATDGFIRANISPDSPRPDSVMERTVGSKPLAKAQTEEETASPVHIRFVSVRKRLCDPDNLSAKWLLDCLRYCGAISGDEPEKITLEVSQEKCVKGESEHTVIEIKALT